MPASSSYRLLIVGQQRPGSTGWSFYKAAIELHFEAVFFDELVYFGSLQHSLAQKLALGLLRRPLGFRSYNLDLLALAKKTQPDVILLVKGEFLAASTLKAVRAHTGARLVVYHPDDFENPLVTTRDMLECLLLYDVVAVPRPVNVAELRAMGCKQGVHVRFGYDPDLFYRQEPTPEQRQRWSSDVLFIGTYTEDRAELLERVGESCDMQQRVFRCYGGGWRRLHRTSKLASHVAGRTVSGEDHRLALGCSRIALGLLRHANRDEHTTRTFEMPVCGAFVLGERSQEHEELLGEGRGMACFSSVAELLEKIDYYLSHEEERRRIAEEGYRRVHQGRCTYRDRLEEILRYA